MSNFRLIPFSNHRTIGFLFIMIVFVFSGVQRSHAQAEEIQAYLGHLVAEEWAEAAQLIDRESLQRLKSNYVRAVQGSNLLSEEQALLGSFGVSSLKELEAIELEDFYVRERSAARRGKPLTPAMIKKKKESFKVTFLGQGPEGDSINHVVLKTKFETFDSVIEQLMMISCKKDKEGNWKIVTDMIRPKVTPLLKPDTP